MVVGGCLSGGVGSGGAFRRWWAFRSDHGGWTVRRCGLGGVRGGVLNGGGWLCVWRRVGIGVGVVGRSLGSHCDEWYGWCDWSALWRGSGVFVGRVGFVRIGDVVDRVWW